MPELDHIGQSLVRISNKLRLEAAKHSLQLNASQFILACRDVAKGKAVERAIEASTA